MLNPLAELIKLGQIPGGVARDLESVADLLRSVRAIQELLATLNAALGPLVTDVERIRETVEPQQKRVAHIEQMMQALSQRTVTIEHAVVGLRDKVDEAIRLLPDPDDDRGPLAKAKEAITGG